MHILSPFFWLTYLREEKKLFRKSIMITLIETITRLFNGILMNM